MKVPNSSSIRILSCSAAASFWLCAMMTLPPLYPSHLLENQYQHLLIATALALEVKRSLRARGAYDPDAYEAGALRDHVTHTAVLREIIHRSQREVEMRRLMVGRKTFLYTKIL